MRTDDLPLKPGDVLAGRYRIDRYLGEGAMGVVVAATHVGLQRPVAVKLLRQAGGEGEVRFVREARIASLLKSEHAGKVLDIGVSNNGVPYFVMELLEGADLSAVLQKRGPLPLGDAVTYILQACEAVAEAHASGVVHRDLKPANLFLTTGADHTPCVKVMDFGVSKLREEDGKLTQTGQQLGSPLYMSPEQLNGKKDLDARSDVWALGVVLFQLLTNELPFLANDLMGLMTQIFLEAPRPFAELRPDVPSGVGNVILCCLEKDRGRRFDTVAALAAALVPYAPERYKVYAERVAGVQRVDVPASRPTDLLPPEPKAAAQTPPSAPPAGVARAATATPTLASEASPAGMGRSRAGRAMVFVLPLLAAVGFAAAYAIVMRRAPREETAIAIGTAQTAMATAATTSAIATTTPTPPGVGSAPMVVPALPTTSTPSATPSATPPPASTLPTHPHGPASPPHTSVTAPPTEDLRGGPRR
jgi:serine/threonine-protein kinase